MTSVRDGATDLYRFYDANDRLLYVGISFSAVARASQHRAEKDWWPDVARMNVEHHPSRATALDAETAAIRAEKPLHNIIGNNPLSAAKLERAMRAGPAATARLRAAIETDTLDIVGDYFLTPPDDGAFPRVNRQGQVVSRLTGDDYIVQLFSWWDGCPTNREIVRFDEMRGWRFYDEHATWLRAGEIGMKANDAHAERRLGA